MAVLADVALCRGHAYARAVVMMGDDKGRQESHDGNRHDHSAQR